MQRRARALWQRGSPYELRPLPGRDDARARARPVAEVAEPAQLPLPGFPPDTWPMIRGRQLRAQERAVASASADLAVATARKLEKKEELRRERREEARARAELEEQRQLLQLLLRDDDESPTSSESEDNESEDNAVRAGQPVVGVKYTAAAAVADAVPPGSEAATVAIDIAIGGGDVMCSVASAADLDVLTSASRSHVLQLGRAARMQARPQAR